MDKRATDELVISLLRTRASLKRLGDFPSASLKRAGSMDAAARLKITELKSRARGYNLVEQTQRLRAGDLKAAKEITRLLVKRTKVKAAFCARCGAKRKAGAAFCGGCGARA